MASGWELHSIDEVAVVSRGRSRHRPRNDPALYGGEYPFVQTADIHASDLYIKSFSQTYSEAGLAQSRLWEPGVICITNAGENTGDCAILGIRACFPDSILALEPMPNKADPVFLKYAVDLLKPQLRRVTRGATQDNLSATKLLAFKFPIPTFSVQTRIGEVLRNYGDLVENNRRRMALLEEAARQLYQEWFVRLRFPGREHTRVTDGVPAGWEPKRLGDAAEVNRKTLAGSFDGEIDYIDISSVCPGQINETTRYNFKDAPSRARRVVEHGDIIWSCVRPNRRSHAVIWRPSPGLIASTGFAVITPTAVPTSFLYQATTTDDFVGYLENHARGAAYPAVVAGDFERALILVPTRSLLAEFKEFTEPLLDQLQNLKVQNQKLRTARDLLLPRLMSGEVAV
jgi:type I restriction enzyme S subunit